MIEVGILDLAILAYVSMLSASEIYDMDWFFALVSEMSILSTVEAAVRP